MTKILAYLRSNAIALLALFVALGGTSYAAYSLPAGSVGARILRNHSITPVKLDPRFTAAFVRDWAVIDGNGHVMASHPRARTFGFGGTGMGTVTWRQRPRSGCFGLATVNDVSPGFAQVFGNPGQLGVQTYGLSGRLAPATVAVAVLCST